MILVSKPSIRLPVTVWIFISRDLTAPGHKILRARPKGGKNGWNLPQKDIIFLILSGGR